MIRAVAAAGGVALTLIGGASATAVFAVGQQTANTAVTLAAVAAVAGPSLDCQTAPAGPASPVPAGVSVPLSAVLAAMRAVGWPASELRTGLAVARGESGTPDGGVGPGTVNRIGASGVWQVLRSAHPEFAQQWTDGSWADVTVNTRMALAVYRAAGGWGPWEAYTNGSWRAHMPEADRVLEQDGVADQAADDAEQAGGEPCVPTAGLTGAEATSAVPCTVGGVGTVQTAPGGVPIRVCAVGPLVVDTRLAPAVQLMVATAATGGLRIAGSGFRSYAEQVALHARNCHPTCHPPTATPGKSMHEWGLAMDLTCNGPLIRSHTNPCFLWLAQHAAAYGLKNLPSESWHWSVNGR